MTESDLWIFLSLSAVFVVLIVAQHVRASCILSRWAAREGLRIFSSEKRYTRSGPFTSRHRQGQFVFRVFVMDAAGTTRTGWVRIGHAVWGVLSDDVLVVWDDGTVTQE